MDRKYYFDLAECGLRMPIGADLVLHQHSDVEGILLDGERLGMVLEETANRFVTPLAVPHMDLELEKKALLEIIGIPQEDMPKFHFSKVPDESVFNIVKDYLEKKPMLPMMQAQVDAIKYIATNTDLLPIGMSIGPFSLMTKLVADPITPVCMAGMGILSQDDEEILMIEASLELGMLIILDNIKKQIEAGAKAIFIAEPAANNVYFSPNQIEEGSDVFERYVMVFNHRIKSFLDENGVDLIFHCCGELTKYIIEQFAALDPAIMSLGSSRKLWEDAQYVPKTTVLYGNLPSKQFYSDSLITTEEVKMRGNELVEKMKDANHPFILGSECDLLSVPGCQEIMMRKADAIANPAFNCACVSV